MVNFQLESWAAIAPGLETREAWRQWLQHPCVINESLVNVSLKQISPLLRRRFSTLGKCAMGAALPIVEGVESIPSIFASRHGDTALSLSLLESMGGDEPMSPTNFSLAVHNAVSGLFSIVRKDTSAVTSIAAMDGLVLQTFFEAIGQLQSVEKVLCVIYDIPLPDFYHHHCDDDTDLFPYAIAMILGSAGGETYSLTQTKQVEQSDPAPSIPFNAEPLRLLRLLAGISDDMELTQNGSIWRIAKVESQC